MPKVIKNTDKLARTPLRKDALEIAEACFRVIDTDRVLEENVRLDGDSLRIKDKILKLQQFKNIYFIGIGKASFKTASYVEKLLGKRIKKGIAIDVEVDKLRRIKTVAGDHPIPSQVNVEAATEIAEIAQNTGENDLVICCISGGGSALFALPKEITLEKLQKLNKALIKSGADIYAVNTVRKHVSQVKGGNLAKMIYPASCISLLFSDVPGDKIEFIASGPTVKDKTTIQDAKNIILKYNLPDVLLSETPKEDKYFETTKNILLVSGKLGLKAMRKKAKNLNYNVEIYSDNLGGEAQEVGRSIVEKSAELLSEKPGALLACGETTVSVVGKGKGGRNQELVLGALPLLEDKQVIVSFSSDGWDHSDAAGAIANQNTQKEANKMGLEWREYLARNDSYHFFKRVGDHIITGKTGANVADFVVFLSAE